MRTLTEKTQTDTSGQITRPFYLIELVMASATYRWSSRQTVDWNSQTWTQNGVQVDELRDLAGGAQEGRISLPNHDRAASALVLAERINGRPIRIWQLYGDAPHAIDDAVALFDGYCDGAPNVAASRVSIEITSAGMENEDAPRLRWELFSSHIPPSGTVISWGGEHYRLERRG
ncbi:MAG: hypothetical protein AB7I42_25625 [Bradyrhizobium sp.]|uniref:hypothetical protein n=1 Tax=Bradyrhizobium sp. TaxID=376 RepID=UPI003D09C67C